MTDGPHAPLARVADTLRALLRAVQTLGDRAALAAEARRIGVESVGLSDLAVVWTEGPAEGAPAEAALPPAVAAEVRRCLSTGRPVHSELPGGGVARVSPLRAEAGIVGALVALRREGEIGAQEEALLEEIGGVVAFVAGRIDQDARRRAVEETLRHRESLLDRTSRIARVGGWSFDVDTMAGNWTDEVARIHDLDPSDRSTVAQGLSFFEGEDRQRIEAAVHEAVTHARPYDLDLRLRSATGAHKWVRTVGRPVEEGGRVVRVEGVIQDISDRKRLELSVARSQDQLRTFVEQSPIAMVLFDNQMNYLATSARWLEMFARGHTSLVGRNHYEFLPDAVERWKPAHERGLAGEQLRNDDDVWVRADGTRMWVRWSIQPWMDEDGEIGGIVLSVEDVTGLRETQLALEEHQHHLEALVQRRTAEMEAARSEALRLAKVKSDFLANMSHEIRTPLNGVLGLAQIGYRSSTDPNSQDIFGRILESGTLLMGILNDILDLSRIEAGKLRVERVPVDLERTLRAAVQLLADRAAARGVDLRLELSPELPATFTGDPLRLSQITLNLLSNAVKFTERGWIVVGAAPEAGRLLLWVEDTGIGMNEEQLTRMFSPFEQGDGSMTRRFGGSGLGLTIARHIVALLGGEIRATSRPGVGSRFEVRLPLDEPRGRIVLGGESAAAVEPGFAPLRLAGVSVLAAEDNEVNRLVLEELLVAEGARLVCVNNGQVAVDTVATEGAGAWDVVLMDIQMPLLDGYEAARRIHAMAPELPIVGLTAHATPSERDRCIAAGMVDHMAKPFDLDLLVGMIRRLVGRPESDAPPRAAPPRMAPPRLGGPEHPPAGPVIDWASLQARFENNPAFIERLVSTALVEVARLRDALHAAASTGDLPALVVAAHGLKGTGGNLAASRLHTLAARLEVAGRSSQLETHRLTAQVLGACDELAVALQRYSPPAS